MIYFNGRRIELEMMHPEIKPMYLKYNSADLESEILTMNIHPMFPISTEIAELTRRMDQIEESYF